VLFVAFYSRRVNHAALPGGTDPLMQPFVVMKGLADGKIDTSVLDGVERKA
jgi:hypothetical protein